MKIARVLTLVTIAFCFCAPVFVSTAVGEPQTRIYHVAADEVIWDYAPSGINQITGEPFGAVANLVMKSGPDRIGHIYKKAQYREYTDDTFTQLKTRLPEWEHLGFAGPLLRAEVGDTIKVIFKNNTTHPASMHPHGVFYTKSSEGAPYKDGSSGKDKSDDSVPPGGTHTYVWPVPERAGPTTHEPSSSFWMYHSHVNETADVNAGLVGPMIVTRKGEARPDGSPKDVDREFVALFAEMDENVSWYFEDNVKTYTGDPKSVPRGVTFADPFYISNLKETINGYSFGHLPTMKMHMGERVRWYLFASTNFEIHTPHWHGNTVEAMHMRTDVISLLPMGMMVADMIPDNPGVWLFHCHVGPHLDAGMITRYEVMQTSDSRP